MMGWSDASRGAVLSTLKDIEVLATAHLAASKDFIEATEARGTTLLYIYEHNPHRRVKDTWLIGVDCVAEKSADGVRHLADAALTFEGMTDVTLDADRNLLVPVEAEVFDRLHVYGIARSIVDMYARTAADADAASAGPAKWSWQWGDAPLELVAHHPDSGVQACYLRGKRAVRFGLLERPEPEGPEYVCRSVQVVAHEIGHAVLDTLKPDLYSYKAGDRAALHEVFADATAIFFLCSVPHAAAVLLESCHGDLRSCTALSATGHQFVQAMPPGDDELDRPAHSPSLRDANNTVTMCDIESAADIDGLTELFTGFLYDLLVNAYMTSPDTSRPRALTTSALRLKDMLMAALVRYCGPEPTFHDVAAGMLRASPPEWGAYVATAAAARGFKFAHSTGTFSLDDVDP
eukprot:TRINITY_DN17000_c0_g2_i1.p1 TRINITY_DN17000_c0_g2~~TRINITY_DN17000_c0_g2_i1.p1  ORF type:complete len:405 (+),score=102.20 TRINITY_DN17000_c0_g2_i1:138-1352(+)